MDLHCHSTASDGRMTPTELVAHARSRRLTVLALTDHDTFAGIEEAAAACREGGPRLVPGVELSTSHQGRRLHLLAWFPRVGAWSAAFDALLRSQQEARVTRLHAICERLERCGVPIDPEALLRGTGGGAVTRPHIARAMQAAGHVGQVQEAFDRFIGQGKPAYIAQRPWNTGEAIAAVHEAGGICGVAHAEPDGFGEPDLLALRGLGMDAVEVVHPSHARQTRRRLRRLAGRFGLLCSGGSDFHGRAGSTLLPRGQLGEPMKRAFLAALDAA